VGNAISRLPGSVVDQSELHGLLKKVRDLAMPLLSINRVVLNQSGVSLGDHEAEGV